MKTKVKTYNFAHTILLSLLTVSLVLSSCVENSGVRGKSSKSGSSLTSGGKGTGAAALPDATDIGEAGTLQSVKVELSHLIDPFDGTYKKKLTIPKNFKGNLYLAGLNVAALSDKLIKVRFNFGKDRQSIVFNATVARAPGIIPQTDIQVLAVDMTKRPFSSFRLGYDLYDYNDYGTVTTPVTDNRDGNLYCRGLLLEDDPTSNQTSCTNAGEKCLYTFASVMDSTLYTTSSGLTSVPTRPQVWTYPLPAGVRIPTIDASYTSMCLPDSNDPAVLSTLYSLSGLGGTYGFPTPITGSLDFRGPYRANDPSKWNIQGDAIFDSKYGLYQTRYPASLSGYLGFNSFLFPRSGKLDLSQNVYYMGSTDPFGTSLPRGVLQAGNTSITEYVDGCNLRVMNFDPIVNEGINSCTVNSNIEVFYMKDNVEVSVTVDKTIKLQLVRASETNADGKEVLATAFKRCDSSSACGSNECCFNSRCWSKDLVSQCVDQVPVIGNQPIGYTCKSDYECSSLCCNNGTGTCMPHNPNGTGDAAVSCAKAAGQKCVSREFCQPTNITVCRVVKGPIVDGVLTCSQRCAPVLTYGDCKAGTCMAPVQPPIPAAPTDCSTAVDP